MMSDLRARERAFAAWGLVLALGLLHGTASVGTAQEIVCWDSVDGDGDGSIDCEDDDCECSCCSSGDCEDGVDFPTCLFDQPQGSWAPVSCAERAACDEGACCFEDRCEEGLGEFWCGYLGGTYQDWSCAAGCATLAPTGACCFAEAGHCKDGSTEAWCELAGGRYLGDATTCELATVDEPAGCGFAAGACCDQVTGECLDGLSERECTDLRPGVFGGPGSDCSTMACEQSVGACCYPHQPPTCWENYPEGQCVATGGVFLGHESTCANVPSGCGLPTGACCHPSGSCSAGETEQRCTQLGGWWQGEGTSCTGFPPPCQPAATGACCMTVTGGVCVDGITRLDCEILHEGTYQGDGTACADVDCPTFAGACCFLGGCAMLPEPTCTFVQGEFQGVGVACEDADCPAVGACCVGDTCTLVDEAECAALGGEFLGVGQQCSPVSCLPGYGACCQTVTGGICLDLVSEMDCEVLYGGTWQGEGTWCIDVDCPSFAGACCALNSCAMVMEATCDNIAGGEFQGVGVTCEDAACPGLGACCVGIGCSMTTPDGCEQLGGQFQGEGVSCNLAGCHQGDVGACCTSGSCALSPEDSCLLAGGQFHGIGTTCDEVECSETGACCLVGGTCIDATVTACEALVGLFQGVGSSCDMPGACDVQFVPLARAWDPNTPGDWRTFVEYISPEPPHVDEAAAPGATRLTSYMLLPSPDGVTRLLRVERQGVGAMLTWTAE